MWNSFSSGVSCLILGELFHLSQPKLLSLEKHGSSEDLRDPLN